MTVTHPDLADQTEANLQEEMARSLRDFNLNRPALLQKAFEEGGSVAVERLLSDFDDLRDAYHSILRAKLDRNNHRYADLLAEATEEVTRLRQSVGSLQAAEKVLEGLASTISVLGRALIVLAV